MGIIAVFRALSHSATVFQILHALPIIDHIRSSSVSHQSSSSSSKQANWKTKLP
jgi:hypothetical protein